MKKRSVMLLACVSLLGQTGTAPPPPVVKPTTQAQLPAFMDATATYINYVLSQNNGKAAQVAALQSQIAQLTADKTALQAQVTTLQSQLSAASGIPADLAPHIQSLVTLMNTAAVASNAGIGPRYVASSTPGSRLQISLQDFPPAPADPAAPLADGWVFLESWTVPSPLAGIVGKTSSETWLQPQVLAEK